MLLQLLVVAKVSPALVPKIDTDDSAANININIDIQMCIHHFENDAALTDPSTAGANLLNCTNQVIDALPEPERSAFMDLPTLLPGNKPPSELKRLEEEVEEALENTWPGSNWCCIAVQRRVNQSKLVLYNEACRKTLLNSYYADCIDFHIECKNVGPQNPNIPCRLYGEPQRFKRYTNCS